MKKVYILASMLLMGQSSWAQIREFQTTRLNSTAGAGVATVLSTEAAILNPASNAFLEGSSFSYQSYSTSLRHENDQRDVVNDDFASRNRSQGIFMSDQDGPVKGGVAYIKQDENDYLREQIISHVAGHISEASSLGFSYKYLHDRLPKGNSPRHETSHQLTVGTLTVLNEKVLMGLTWVDPTRTTPGEERAFLGLQYTITDRLTLIGDIGTQFTQDVKDKHIWRVAAQLQPFDDFFLRIGQFYDNVQEFKGTGWGLGWIGPKLGVEFAQKISEQFGENGYIYQDESLVDTSLSAIIKF